VTEKALFTKDMSILDALQADPRAREIFSVHGMGCIGCMGATMESIENGAKMHGIDPRAILEDLNRLIELPEPTEA
jgi:hybrid cluster-associated redox disulfide protein